MTPADIAYLRQAAARDGYNPDDALKVFAKESSGRPDIWGGKGGNYFGLFQAGPSERQQFGVKTGAEASATNQIDAFGRFLKARGYKPGMGLMDMYSTVLAGSPGHYNRSDGYGTVAQHVASMGGGSAAGGGPRGGYRFALDDMPAGMDFESAPAAEDETPEDKAAKAEEQAQASRKSLISSLETITNRRRPQIDMAQIEAQNRAFQEFANQQHQRALGLLTAGPGLLGA